MVIIGPTNIQKLRKLTKKPRFSAGFTLIERLVVIALIVLLASIVVVVLKDAREKARITKTLRWNWGVHYLLGPNCVGWWNFDYGSSVTAPDDSGNGNDGTIHGATPTDDLNNASYSALYFDGVGDYVDCGNDESLNITDAITIEAWVRPSALSGERAVVANWHEMPRKGYCLGTTNNLVKFWIAKSDGTYDYINSVGTINTNWNYIAGVYDGSSLKIFINGSQDNSKATTQQIDYTSENLVAIGRLGAINAQYFNGIIDEVRIYKKAIPEQAIREHYLAGLERHQNLVKR